ncbi:G-protein coupled receptor GRL101-like [Lytechinus variegatus]|uniref:G-protein coupled receptor GRL101-like n=1 Tax=Lytechinus variegatus TaxID=7654 RepID=UPI001BB1F673|nr:G-protein coupled receptor GRL101-like [Lytechinus variegatus]
MHMSLQILILVTLSTGVLGNQDVDELKYVTTLVSPNFPDPYPYDSSQEYIVESSPEDKMIRVLFYSLEIERFWDLLTFTHTSHQDNTVTSYRLGTNEVTSLSLASGHLAVRFCSDRAMDLKGFALNIFTTDNHIVTNTTDDFICASGTQSITQHSHCDMIVDCHDFSDEDDCGFCPDEAFHCRGSDICILPRLQCDGWPDCPHGDDEEMCEIIKCPYDCSCGESFFYAGWGPRSQPCSKPEWLPFWVNCTTTWNGDYAKSSAVKSTVINLSGTPLFGNLEVSSFYGLHQLHAIYLDSCQLEYLPPGIFRDNNRVWRMALLNNSLTFLENGTFDGLTNLRALYMEYNLIARLDEGCFRGLDNILIFDLQNNSLSDLRHGSLADMGGSLQRLIFENNFIRSINSSLLAGLEDSLVVLNMQGNPIEEVAPESFTQMRALEDLHLLSAKKINLYPEIFKFGPSFQTLFVFDPRICCIMPDSLTCTIIEPPHPLFTCRKTFLQNDAVKVFIWILGISALVGNAIVVFMRLTTSSPNSTPIASIQSTLITNLAVADFLMGVYMVILAVMDLVIGDTYFWGGRAEEWRSSLSCQIAGFVSFLSSEASVFMLTLISVDRFISIIFPFSLRRLTVGSARVAVSMIWIGSILLAIGSILVNRSNPDAYSLSDVCVGLPLIRKLTDFNSEFDTYTFSQFGHTRYNIIASSSISTWQFSIAVFLGLNLISFVVILLCYIAIFFKVRLTRKEVGRKAAGSSDDVRMALKMSLIVGTDFFCWMPIIVLGILVQSDVIILSSDVYAWLVVFVLPINSSLNPFLYTLIERLQK